MTKRTNIHLVFKDKPSLLTLLFSSFKVAFNISLTLKKFHVFSALPMLFHGWKTLLNYSHHSILHSHISFKSLNFTEPVFTMDTD